MKSVVPAMHTHVLTYTQRTSADTASRYSALISQDSDGIVSRCPARNGISKLASLVGKGHQHAESKGRKEFHSSQKLSVCLNPEQVDMQAIPDMGEVLL